jgi:hypothetical protein
VLLYRLRLAGRETIDLMGAGDLLRPWPPVDEYAELFTASRWKVLESAELAVLDIRFLREAAPWPELLIALGERLACVARHPRRPGIAEVRLRVGVDQKHAPAPPREHRPEVGGRRRLRHPALVVR